MAVTVEATWFYCFPSHMKMVVMRSEMFEDGLVNSTQAEEAIQLLVKSVKLM